MSFTPTKLPVGNGLKYVDRGLKKVLSCPVCISSLKFVDHGLKKVLSCPVSIVGD